MASARDYQIACHDSVLAAWGEKPWHKEGGDVYRSVVVNLTTSAGKTFIAGLIMQSVRDRGNCLFLADTDELCNQPVKNFYRMFKMHASIEKAGERASPLSDVVIGSAQTLARKERLQRWNPDHFSYIFVDEAHRGSPRNKEIYDYFPAAKVMGMTATAFRAKLKDLSDFYDAVAFEMGMFDLIDEGYVAPLKVLTLPVRVDISKVRQVRSLEGTQDYDANELDTTIRPYYEEICRMVLEHAADRRIITFLPLIKSSQEFIQIAQDMGIKAKHIDGKSTDRALIEAQFEAGEFQLLSNSSLLTTGWDCPPCDCLLNLAPTRSAGLFQQKVGRIGRLLAGVIDGLTDKDERKAAIAASAKPDALILDLLWQTERFGLMGPADLVAGNEEEKKALQLKLAGLQGAHNLQKVARDLQAERDEALRLALIAAAKRQRLFTGGLVDAALVATTLHARKVVDYEPVMKWQRKEVSEKQKELLAKFRVDPATVKDKGHASAMLDVLLGRLRKGMASFIVVEALEKRAIADAAGFNDWQAYNILGGNYPMPFSQKHYGRELRQVPTNFWRWCKTQDWIEKKWPIVWNWMTSVLDPDAATLEQARCQCIGSHQAPNCPVHPRCVTEDDTSHPVLDLFDCLDD